MAMNSLTHDVIVCVHNAAEDTKKCLDSLLADIDLLNKIVVVDDASGSETRNLLREYADRNPIIRIIRNETAQRYTRAANTGLKASAAELRTLLNSDTILPAGWAARVQKAFFANPALGILGPLSNAASYQSVPGIVGKGTQTAINDLPADHGVSDLDSFCAREAAGLDIPYVPLVHGFCFTVSESCLNSVGYLDEELFPKGYGEENDYCFRAADAGFLLGIASNIFVFHAKSKSYQGGERATLMKDGWEALVAKYGRRRLVNSINHMEQEPTLARMRERVANQFYRSSASAKRDGAEWPVKTIAFYLPQFHPIPENDRNWGEGFTEWMNVSRGRPRFPNHQQPKLPGKLGFYDLRSPDVHRQQIELAAAYGVDCFCMYYYRFGKQRLMSTPPKIFRSVEYNDVSFCYCWANESWTRAWDGATSDVILSQAYDDDTLEGLAEDVSDAIGDERHLRVAGKPVLLIYQVAEIPAAAEWLARLRASIRSRTNQDILIGSVFSLRFNEDTLKLVDFVVQFPPHRIVRKAKRETISPESMKPYEPERKDYYEGYDAVVNTALDDANMLDKMVPGVCPDWDNTPRRQTNAHTLVGATPEKFSGWVEKAATKSYERFMSGKAPAPLLFVNAWNEWAEGAFLEPSAEFGTQYLEALKKGLEAAGAALSKRELRKLG